MCWYQCGTVFSTKRLLFYSFGVWFHDWMTINWVIIMLVDWSRIWTPIKRRKTLAISRELLYRPRKRSSCMSPIGSKLQIASLLSWKLYGSKFLYTFRERQIDRRPIILNFTRLLLLSVTRRSIKSENSTRRWRPASARRRRASQILMSKTCSGVRKIFSDHYSRYFKHMMFT